MLALHTEEQLCLKSHEASSASALPPELASRRWLCPAETGQIIPGYAPGSGLALRSYWAKGRTKGRAQK